MIGEIEVGPVLSFLRKARVIEDSKAEEEKMNLEGIITFLEEKGIITEET
jgi:hypothetical protein